jgi:hypothetical protein
MPNNFYYFFSFLLVVSWSTLHGQSPFELDEGFRQIVVPTTFHKQSQKALFDNGAQLTVFFVEKEEDLKNFKVVHTAEIIDAENRRKKTYLTKGNAFSIAGIKVPRKIEVLVVVGIPKLLKERGIQLIVGNNVIGQSDWMIDFKTQTLSNCSPDLNYTTDDYFELPLISLPSTPYATVVQSNNQTDTVGLDFGYNGTLMTGKSHYMSAPQWEKYTLSESSIETRIDTQQMGAQNQLMFAGGWCVQQLPVYRSERVQRSLLGIDFLKAFDRLLLLNSERKLLLQKRENHQYTFPSWQVYNNKVVSVTKAIKNLRKVPKRSVIIGAARTASSPPAPLLRLPLTQYQAQCTTD